MASLTDIPEGALRSAFARFAPEVRNNLLELRELIFDVAAATPEVGKVEETLKWGQPAYLTKTGTTIRLGQPKSGGYAVYTHCQSRVIPDFRALFPDDFDYDGSRAVVFRTGTQPDLSRIALLIRSALTYRLQAA